MKTLKASIILLMMAVMAFAGTAYAAPVLIGSITDGIEEPARVALDAQGNIYVSEPAEGRVNKYNSKGEQVGFINVARPYGVAVSADGTIYVCSVQVPAKKNGYVNKSAVLVYSPALKMTGTIGGAGEFSAPVDIAIDGAGSLYVADMKQGVVKVFDANGGYTHSIGGGHLRSDWTQGVAVNDAANSGDGEVYVADTVKSSVQGYTVDMPRISVFTKNGAYLRTLSSIQFGTEAGRMKKPSGIAVDRSGQVLVADTGNNVVHVLSAADGSPVGEGGLYANAAYRPGGVAVSRSNVAYVAWQSGRVDAFCLDGCVTMAVAPTSLTFEARQYSDNPPIQTATIANAGSGTLNWTAKADKDWITVDEQGAAGPGSSVDLAVGVNAANLASGTYSGTVTITSALGEQATISVGLTVAQPLMLNISNWSPSFSIKKGNNTESTSVTVSIDGGAGSWSIAPESLPSWLTVAPLSGDAAATTVTFTASAANEEAGSTVALVPVSAPGVIGNGSKFTVSLTVNAATKISVSTNNADATFAVVGKAAKYEGKGKSWSVDDAPAGDYTVTFGPVDGFKKPVPETKSLAESSAVSFIGVYASYKDLAKKKNIVVAKGPAASADARVKLYKNNGAAVAFDLVALETLAGASVAAGDVDGDGAADLIVGAGAGANNPAVVRVFRAFDKAMMAEFVPFGTLNGASVAAADLNGDGKAEIIVSDNSGTIAVFTVVEGRMTMTGIELKGATAAAADTEGDGRPEIVTATEKGVVVWKIDAAPKAGAWTAVSAGTFAVAASSLAAADTDGDGMDEIIAGVNGAASTASSVVILGVKKGSQSTFAAFDKYGIVVAAADLDGDGKAEVIAGAGDKQDGGKAGKMNKRDGDKQPGNGNSDHEEGTVRVYNAAGALQFVIKAFDDATNGVNLAVGDLGL